jgi:hypothetical protein
MFPYFSESPQAIKFASSMNAQTNEGVFSEQERDAAMWQAPQETDLETEILGEIEMNAKKLIAAVIVSACATGAFAATTPQADFANTFTPYEVTAQNATGSSGSNVQAKNAGAGEQAMSAVNFANTLQPWEVTAQSAAQPVRSSK